MWQCHRPSVIYFLILGFVVSLVVEAQPSRHSTISNQHVSSGNRNKYWSKNTKLERGIKLVPSAMGLERTPVIIIPGTGGSQLEARQINCGQKDPDKQDESVKQSSALRDAIYQSTRKLKKNMKKLQQKNTMRSVPSESSPGDQLAEKMEDRNVSNVVKTNCTRQQKHGWYRLWMDVWQLLPSEVECWANNMMLYYDEESGDSMNAMGLEIRVPGWGNVESIEYVDPSFSAWILGNAGSYMAPFIHELESLGYKRGVDLRGAPYDFRYRPNSQDVFFRKLQHLIENTYYLNGRKKVALITHSMGGLFGTYFLNLQTQEWKDHFIALFTTINTPWEGTAYMPHYLVSGSNFGIDEIDAMSIRKQLRSYETSPFMLPSLDAWGDERVLVETPERNYTAADYGDLFEDLDYKVGEKLWRMGREDWKMTHKHPGVDMYCLYSTGTKTVESARYAAPIGLRKPPQEGDQLYSNDAAVDYKDYYYYSDDVYSYDTPYRDDENSQGENASKKDEHAKIDTDRQQPISYRMGDGDGTVNRRSLVGCSRFYNSDYPFHMRHYRNRSHNGILGHKRFFKMMRNLLLHL